MAVAAQERRPRIVSLLASATEIVCALGFADHLVGRSHECDYPPAIRRLPVLTEPKFDVHGSSRDIDQRVKAVLQEATSVYRVHADRLQEVQPDVIVTQTQCEVCAVSPKEVEEALCTWLGTQPRIVALAPNCLADIWNDTQRVAEALGVPKRGQELVEHLQQRIEDIAESLKKLSDQPTVVCLEWLDPLMAAGNWMPELVELAGGRNLFGAAGRHAPWITWEQLQAADPEVLIAMPCGFDLTTTRREMTVLTERGGWRTLQAVRTGRVYVTDGNQYFNRPGPRLVESLEILAEILYPGWRRPVHEGTGWALL